MRQTMNAIIAGIKVNYVLNALNATYSVDDFESMKFYSTIIVIIMVL